MQKYSLKKEIIPITRDIVLELHNKKERLLRTTQEKTIKEIKEEDGLVTIYGNDTKTRGMLIGRDKHKINSINDIHIIRDFLKNVIIQIGRASCRERV